MENMNLTETKPKMLPDDGWVLTSDEEERVIAQARYDKIKHKQWLLRNRPEGQEVFELDEDEIQAALIQANKTKAAKILFEQYAKENRERKRAEFEKVVAEWDYAGFYRNMQKMANLEGKRLFFNDQTKDLIKTICFKLSADPRYETEMGFSFQKGLIIRGPFGIGKSWIPSLVANNPVCPMQIITMHEIVSSVKKTGDFDGLKMATHVLIYFDDVGTEYANTKSIKHYGTETNWFASWFEEFYARNKKDIRRLILSTNDDFATLEDKYGARVRDRMAECFDVLDVHGDSMRRI